MPKNGKVAGWRKAPGKQNPRVAKSFDKWIIKFDHPRLSDYLWTGSGLKPGIKMWSGMRPKEFDSEREALAELVGTVLDHIVRYKSDFEEFITGWTNPALKKASPMADQTVAQQLLGHLLAALRAAQQSHWTAHWTVEGTSYGDHLLFERLYEGFTKEIDALAEKMVAMFGAEAVNFPEQMKWQALLAHEWDQEPDLYRRAWAIEQFLQTHFLKTYEALKGLQQMTLGLDDFLMATANAHETNVYLLGQRLSKTAARLKYKVYLFSDEPGAKPLWTKEFYAQDDARADQEALRLVKPVLNRFDNAEDWVVEPVGHKGRTARTNQKIIEAPHTFYPVKVESPTVKRKDHPFEGFIDFQGLKIDEENVSGSVRRGKGPNGDWSTSVRRVARRYMVAKGLFKVPLSTSKVEVQPPRKKRSEFPFGSEFPFEGFIDFQGLAIHVENVRGSTRKGVDPDGTPWEVVMKHHYGEVDQTEGVDHDPVDIYVGPNGDSPLVVVVRQQDPKTKKYDEDKVMVGFDTEDEALKAYKAQYNSAGFYQNHKSMPIGRFLRWCLDRDNRGKKVSRLNGGFSSGRAG